MKCYGCGRCLPACPLGLIKEEERHLSPKDFGPLFSQIQPDAVEIHTASGRAAAFETTLKEVVNARVSLKRIAVSLAAEQVATTSETLAQELWQRHICLREHGQKPLWQIDGRPMSGDTGANATKTTIKMWQNLLPLAPPGPLQLAGGTNLFTFNYLPPDARPEGVAFGSMARK